MLFLTNVLRSTGTMSFNLLIQLRMKEIGATLFLIGLLSSLRGAVNTFSNVFWGRISDRTGKRRVFIISSLVLASAFYPLYAVVDVPSAILIVSMIIAFSMECILLPRWRSAVPQREWRLVFHFIIPRIHLECFSADSPLVFC